MSESGRRSNLPVLYRGTTETTEFILKCLREPDYVKDRRDKMMYLVKNKTEMEMIDKEIDCFGRRYDGECGKLADKVRFGNLGCIHPGEIAWKFIKTEIVSPIASLMWKFFFFQTAIQFFKSLPSALTSIVMKYFGFPG